MSREQIHVVSPSDSKARQTFSATAASSLLCEMKTCRLPVAISEVVGMD
jgi:hypothetical protein